jgi:3-hydroxybenzoate 6-monooxygenase
LVHRADLHSVFLEACLRRSNVTLINNQVVTGYANTAFGAKVVTAAGDEYEGDAVVGADGVRSRIRAQMTGGDELRLSGHIAYRAVLKLEQMPADLRWDDATLWAGPKCHMVHYPLQGWKTFNLVATFVTDVSNVGANEAGTREEVPNAWRRWVLADRNPIENWVDGRVVLLGDAAHPTHQYFAQGACMAMEDSVMLSHQLEQHDGDFEAAFAAYQKARTVRAYRVVISSRLIGKHIYHPEGAERSLRNAVMAAKTLQWIYGGTGLTRADLQTAA